MLVNKILVSFINEVRKEKFRAKSIFELKSSNVVRLSSG